MVKTWGGFSYSGMVISPVNNKVLFLFLYIYTTRRVPFMGCKTINHVYHGTCTGLYRPRYDAVQLTTCPFTNVLTSCSKGHHDCEPHQSSKLIFITEPSTNWKHGEPETENKFPQKRNMNSPAKQPFSNATWWGVRGLDSVVIQLFNYCLRHYISYSNLSTIRPTQCWPYQLKIHPSVTHQRSPVFRQTRCLEIWSYLPHKVPPLSIKSFLATMLISIEPSL